MKAYIDTGCESLDLMIEAVMRSMDPIGQDVCICSPDKDVPSQYTKICYICDSVEASAVNTGSSDSKESCRYLTLPLSIPALRECIIALSNTASAKKTAFIYDDSTGKVTSGNSCVKLSTKEAELFTLLLSSRGTPLSREELRHRLWQGTEGTNAPDVYISYLRRKLSPIFGEGFIVNVRGTGYMLREHL